MTESKNQAFHRLAEKRVETIEDGFRIFSNLCGPSYERTPAEVLAYFARIDAARDTALGRFHEQKWWRDEAPAVIAPESLPDAVGYDGPIESGDPAPEAPVAISEGWRGHLPAVQQQRLSEEALEEMIAMQRGVIERLQDEINTLRGGRTSIAA